MRFVAANLHPDHDTVAVFRRTNKAALEAALLHVLLLARETGLLRLGTVSIDGTKIDANASKLRSVRYDRACALRTKLAADIAHLTAQAEAADAEGQDPQALPAELARREALKAKLDAACDRLEADARAQAEAARPMGQADRVAHAQHDGGEAWRVGAGREQICRQDKLRPVGADHGLGVIGLAILMHLRTAHQRAVGIGQVALPVGRWRIVGGLGLTVLADTGYASGPAIKALKASNVEPLVAIGRTQPHRPYDFRPPPDPKTPRRITAPWRIAMKAKMETDDAKTLYKKRKQSVETVFGILKSAMGFRRFHLRGIKNAAIEWTLIALA